MAGEVAAGVNLSGPVCGIAGWSDGSAADLCDGHSACRSARPGTAARDAFRGSFGGFVDDAGETDQTAGRRDDAGVCRDLWRGYSGLWLIEEHLAKCGGAGDCRGKRYGQRGGSLEPSAVGDTAGDARARECGELAVYRSFERVR